MKVLADLPHARAERHATALLHDERSCRVAGFTLSPGQEVPVHTSASTVTVLVVEGAGTFIGKDTRIVLRAGQALVYEPNEPHGMIAGDEGLRFVAVITPGPAYAGGR